MTMTRAELVAFLRREHHWVEASVNAGGGPQAAVVGVAVSDDLELVFDTLSTSRKGQNLRRDPRIALVMWHGEVTVQIEGYADEPQGDDLARCKKVYFAQFPDGPSRSTWPNITYVRVRPAWLRHTDFAEGERVTELDPRTLAP